MANTHKHEPGQPVHVHARGAWRSGAVTRLDDDRVVVRFNRNRHGQTDVGPFPAVEVLPADGVNLTPVRDLRAGDMVVIAGQHKIVSATRPHPHKRRRRIEVSYTDGDVVALPSATRLRVKAPSAGEA